MSWQEYWHDDADALGEALAAQLLAALQHGLERNGHAVLALAGGRTPVAAYRQLAGAALDWSRVSLVATDERWVAPDHPASNTGALRQCFRGARGLRILPLTPQAPDFPASAGLASARFARATLAALAEPFDAVLLGMGTDGHFASLFPGAAELPAGLDPGNADEAILVNPEPLPADAPHARVSLTLARLLRTRRLLLGATGPAKHGVLERAQASLDPLGLPVSALLHQSTVPVEIHWSP